MSVADLTSREREIILAASNRRTLSAVDVAIFIAGKSYVVEAARAEALLSRCINVREPNRIRRVPLRDVIMLKSTLKYIDVVTSERTYLIEDSLKRMECEFGDAMVRVHRACLVARARIIGFERAPSSDGTSPWVVRLSGTPELPRVSRRNQPIVRMGA